MHPKRKYIRSRKITEAAEGEMCTVASPHCNFDPRTTVYAHSNDSDDGKGIGIKAEDIYGCFACSDCHTWLDCGSDSEADWYMNRAIKRTMKILFEKGIYKIV